MGCDIHMYVEYKVDDGEWKAHEQHIEEVEDEYKSVRSVTATGRNYDLFGLLAGVRTYSDGRVKPKGLPKNISPMIKRASEYWGGDGHSHSHMTLEQFEKVLEDYNRREKDYKIKPTKRTDMFYSHDMKYEEHPPSFSTVVSGCKRHAEELKADFILLGQEPPKIKHRLIFWFDN